MSLGRAVMDSEKRHEKVLPLLEIDPDPLRKAPFYGDPVPESTFTRRACFQQDTPSAVGRAVETVIANGVLPAVVRDCRKDRLGCLVGVEPSVGRVVRTTIFPIIFSILRSRKSG